MKMSKKDKPKSLPGAVVSGHLRKQHKLVKEIVNHPLAHNAGLRLVLGLLIGSGAMCPKCGFGTRATSKNWARCKQCGERVPRVKMSDIKIVQGSSDRRPN